MLDVHSAIEDFATLRASLDDPFLDRAAFLAKVRLDAAAYVALTDAWRARIARDMAAGGDLGERFAAAYRQAAAARRAYARGEDAVVEGDVRFLSRVAQPWRAEAARVSLLATNTVPPLQTALEAAEPLPSARAPRMASRSQSAPEPRVEDTFAAPPLTTPAQIAPSPPPVPHAAGIPRAAPGTRPQGGPAVLLSEVFETKPLPPSLRSASAPVLPFTASPAPASAAPAAPHAPREGLPFRSITPEPKAAPVPCPSAIPAHLLGAIPAEGPNAPPNKRLIRFDPQTGQPLPFPVWVDVAPPEEERKR